MTFRPSHPRIGGCLLALFCAPALAQQAPPNPASGGQPRALLRGIASASVFSGVNRNDARASLKVWFDELARQRGHVLDSTVDIVDNVAEIRERLRTRSVELLSLGARDYLELESSGLLVPVLTDARTTGAAAYPYLLLVNSTSGISNMAGLRGKSILVSARGNGETGTAWLEILLAKEKLPHAASFFSSVKASAKPQACILPVFFGTADACVVDAVNLKLAQEMNPQLERLMVLARSRPLVEGVIGVPSDPHPYQQELVDSMLTLHEDPRGRQLLMVFGTERLVRLQPGDLESIRELWRDYQRLIAGSQPAGNESPRRATGGH